MHARKLIRPARIAGEHRAREVGLGVLVREIPLVKMRGSGGTLARDSHQ